MINRLNLTRFRLHSSATFDFSQPNILIIGPNASGKTAIIEAIYLVGTGDSFRAERIEEMIQFEAELARVKAEIADVVPNFKPSNPQPANQSSTTHLEVILTRGLVQGKRTQRRLFSVNQIKKRKKDFVGLFQVVLFKPEDLRLVEGSPGRRRRFLDQLLASLFPDYAASLKTYEHTLKKRNRLLVAVRDGEQPRSVLSFWNLSLIKHGQLLQNYRQKLLASFNQLNLPLKYRVVYLPKIINQKRQLSYLSKEVAAGHSLIGPHKDDFRVDFFQTQTSTSLLDVSTYGSRGQQRLAVLWLKAAEGAFRKSHSKAPLVWLLDDVLSELDLKSRQLALSLTDCHQTIITTTDSAITKLVKPDKIIKLSNKTNAG